VIDDDLDRSEFVHHLGIPHGDDYFCLAAELGTGVVGYLSAGGSRDDDHKSYGEFYELAVDPVVADADAVGALVRSGFGLLVNAQYGGVIAWVDEGDVLLIGTLISIGFTPDDRAREHRSGQRRYGTVLPPR
jgi:hypothetical protein